MSNPFLNTFLSEKDVVKKIDSIKESYYTCNKKNTFFKNNQKFDIANQVCNNIRLSDMIVYSIYIIPGTNKIYFNYPLFKNFATPENYADSQCYLQLLTTRILQQFDSFEMHINLASFSISACQRFFGAIQSLFETTTELTDRMRVLHVYNTPHVIEQIRRILNPLINPILPRVIYYNKNESGRLIQNLHNEVKTT
tara:strand:- start:2053 stop:2640 length:588 start_codon:yes stop_codon:yes gene_type:complete